VEHGARAAFHTFTAGQAVGIFNMYPQPGMPADVNTYRAIEITNATLHAAALIRDNMARGNCAVAFGFNFGCTDAHKRHMVSVFTGFYKVNL
jgi:hypothetical protein